MNEILFRGKRVDNGEWVCSGNLIHFNEDNEYYIPVVNSACTCTHDESDNIIEWNEVMFCKVIPETVGQYTGVTDKNGKKIFEGDIIKHYTHVLVGEPEKYEVGVIRWNERFLAWERTTSDESEPLIGYVRISHTSVYEVIGNIRDNPELLEEEV